MTKFKQLKILVLQIGKIVPETTVKQAAKQGIEQTTQNQINKIK